MNKISASLVVSICMCHALSAQFYPNGNASWCLYNNSSPNGYDVTVHMAVSADTVINGVSYHRIVGNLGFWPYSERYVRSTSDGKGYIYIPDLAQEFLTGDLNAVPGDTIQNVAVSNGTGSCPIQDDLMLTAVIVDSISSYSNNGVEVIRSYVRVPCYDNSGSYDPASIFWQGGIGTSHGALLILSAGLSHLDLQCAVVDEVSLYDIDLGNGLPGGGSCCSFLPSAINEIVDEYSITVIPNPSPFHFQLTGPVINRVQVFDVLGKEVLTTTGNSIDLSTQPQGHYFARVETPKGLRVVHLVVAR